MSTLYMQPVWRGSCFQSYCTSELEILSAILHELLSGGGHAKLCKYCSTDTNTEVERALNSVFQHDTNLQYRLSNLTK